jgi:hypothetical protein
MTLNQYFPHFTTSSEQGLIEELYIEAIQQRGIDCYYLPRTNPNLDEIYLEDRTDKYEEAIAVEVYIKNAYGFMGDGDFLSNLGVEIRPKMVFNIAKQRFLDEIGYPRGFSRPREGDIIYFPLNKRVFVVQYVEKFEVFYQLGQLYSYEMTCELFEYGGQDFTTGITDIDDIMNLSLDTFDWALLTEDGYVIQTEDNDYLVIESYDADGSTDAIDPLDDSDRIEDEADDIINFSEADPFSEGNT